MTLARHAGSIRSESACALEATSASMTSAGLGLTLARLLRVALAMLSLLADAGAGCGRLAGFADRFLFRLRIVFLAMLNRVLRQEFVGEMASNLAAAEPAQRRRRSLARFGPAGTAAVKAVDEARSKRYARLCTCRLAEKIRRFKRSKIEQSPLSGPILAFSEVILRGPDFREALRCRK